jgi:predicted nucleic acid-binding protein
MKAFADTFHFISLVDPTEPQHRRCSQLSLLYRHIVTSDFVLIELLNYFANFRVLRLRAAQLVQWMRRRPDFEVISASRELFDESLRLYQNRPDKDWSLTDCSSFLIMQELGIDAALTADKHFVQAGLDALLLD